MTELNYKYHVFLSHNGAQKDWTRQLADKLRQAGVLVFFDEDSIRLGDDILRSIESGLKYSRHIFLVLSPAAVASDWVALEYSSAMFKHPAAAERAIIPLLRETCDIPLMLARLKYLDVTSDDLDRQVGHLLKAIEFGDVVQASPKPSPASQTSGVEGSETSVQILQPQFQFVFGKPVSPSSKAYIQRDADLIARSAIDSGGTLTVFGPRQVGKTSLLVGACDYAKSLGKRVVLVDFQMLAGGASAAQLYYSVARKIALELEFDDPDARGYMQNPSFELAEFLRKLPRDVVLMFDEFDALHGVKLVQAFSGILRSLNLQSVREDDSGPTVFIASWLPLYRYDEDKFTSPMNVGRQVRLANFTRAQAEGLTNIAAPSLTGKDLDSFFSLVGGQPFLLQSGLSLLANGTEILELAAVGPDGPFSFHLESIGHSIKNKVREKLKRGGLSKLSNLEKLELLDVGLLSWQENRRYAWSCGLYKLAYGNGGE